MFSSNTSQVSNDANYIEDVFSTYLYTGTGASQTITNGIDLSTKGGLVWLKYRSGGGNPAGHFLYTPDLPGSGGGYAYKHLQTNNANAAGEGFNALNTFNSNGFSLGGNSEINYSGDNYVSWTFRKQPKFFDVVTYTGDGTTSRTIPHSLGSTPGMVVIKSTSASGSNWIVWHRGLTGTNPWLLLNTDYGTGALGNYGISLAPSSTTFTCGKKSTVAYTTNDSGATYVAYLFAHDAGGFGLTGTDNVISCGSFTDSATVSLGYEPQWIMVKRTNDVSNWYMVDTMRGLTANFSGSAAGDAELFANLSSAELAPPNGDIGINSTGFRWNGSAGTYIYIAIRRGPMKVPTDATKVFAPVVFTDVDKLTTAGFPVDTAIEFQNISASNLQYFSNRLTAPKALNSRSTAAETTETQNWASNTQVQLSNQGNSYTRLYHMFRRAPSFMDVVCYTGTGSITTVTHNLGVAPELIIAKSRSGAFAWTVYSATLGNSYPLFLNYTSDGTTNYGTSMWGSATPTATQFSVGTYTGTNSNGQTYVAYLFATCAGVSKVFSYTGNGSSQTINCGFTGGARWILIKRTDSTGDWYVWDSARGIVSGNDPHLSLNTTAAEVTSDDTIDTDSTGFVVNQVSATDVNVSSATYIGIAIA